MIETRPTVPQIGMTAGTRRALGAGIGMLLARRLDKQRRNAFGWTLVPIGDASTIPLVYMALRSARVESRTKTEWIAPMPQNSEQPEHVPS